MKTRLLFLTFCICSFSLYSQITLEHTFTNTGNGPYLFHTHNATMFYRYDIQSNTITIYNSDYSLYKTITVPALSGYTFSSAENFSTKLFNLDNLIEFVVCYRRDTGNNYDYKLILYSENMNQIMDFGNFPSGYAYTTMDNKTKFKVTHFTYTSSGGSTISDFYSLPGSIANPNPMGLDDSEILNDYYNAYPNPAGSYINLPYKINMNERSVMRIYNSKGELIEQKNIEGQSRWLKLKTDNYTPGMYIFEFNGNSGTFIVE